MVKSFFSKPDGNGNGGQTLDLDKIRLTMDVAKLAAIGAIVVMACKFYYTCQNHLATDWMVKDHIIWSGNTAGINTPENLQKYGWRPADPYGGGTRP